MKSKPTLLLHSCCAPCSSAVLERLQNEFSVTVFYFNPNIFPKTEYQRRLAEQKRFLKQQNIPIIQGKFDPKQYHAAIMGHEALPEKSLRCFQCYKLRLEQTALTAQKLGFDFFTTTLSISPHKNADWINQIGQSLSTSTCQFLPANFKKQNGYLRSLELSKVYGFYRQNYCGCEMSLRASAKKLEKPSQI